MDLARSPARTPTATRARQGSWPLVRALVLFGVVFLAVAGAARFSEGGGESAQATSLEEPRWATASPEVAADGHVELTVDRVEGMVPLEVTFAYRTVGAISSWALDLDGDGVPERAGEGSASGTVESTYLQPGVHEARMAGFGKASVKDARVTVKVRGPLAWRKADAAGDAALDEADIRLVEAESGEHGLDAAILLTALPRHDASGEYTLTVNGRPFTSRQDAPTSSGPASTGPDGAPLPPGSSTWDEASGAVRFHLDAGILAKHGVRAPYDIVASARVVVEGTVLSHDQAPDAPAGTRPLLDRHNLG